MTNHEPLLGLKIHKHGKTLIEEFLEKERLLFRTGITKIIEVVELII